MNAIWLLLSLAFASEELLVGIDHVMVAVEDVEVAARTYQSLGFAIKPGRPHANGIVNRHVKFPDGSEIELITAPAATDALATHYRQHLDRHGEGPAFAGLFVADRPALIERLQADGLAPKDAGLITLPDASGLRFLFFGTRNQSPTDRPEHFAHANGAMTLLGVWLAPDDPARLAELLSALGADEREEETNGMGEGWPARVFHVPEGFVAIVDPQYREVPDRPVLGVTVATNGVARIIAPDRAHGLWLELRPAQD